MLMREAFSRRWLARAISSERLFVCSAFAFPPSPFSAAATAIRLRSVTSKPSRGAGETG